LTERHFCVKDDAINRMVLAVPRQTRARAKPRAGKRYPLNMRTTKAIRDKLEHAAATAGRSLAQEVELRLEQSFLLQELMVTGLELTYGRQLAGMLLMLGEGIKMTGENTGFSSTLAIDGSRNWVDVAYAFDQAVQCANYIFERLRPPGKPETPAILAFRGLDLGENNFTRLGHVYADTIVSEAMSGESQVANGEKRAKTMHDLLGPLVNRLKDSNGDVETLTVYSPLPLALKSE
jgi:hypothetical protein